MVKGHSESKKRVAGLLPGRVCDLAGKLRWKNIPTGGERIFTILEELHGRRAQRRPRYCCSANSINCGGMGEIPFNSGLIRTAPISLFISTCRVLISNRLHNTARSRGLAPNASAEFNFVGINKSVFLPRFHTRIPRVRRARARARATCIQFSISGFPMKHDVTHPRNNVSRNPLIKRTILVFETISATSP